MSENYKWERERPNQIFILFHIENYSIRNNYIAKRFLVKVVSLIAGATFIVITKLKFSEKKKIGNLICEVKKYP